MNRAEAEQSTVASTAPLRSWSDRALNLAVGLSVFTLSNYLFDYILYPLAIYKLGFARGTLLMTVLSLVINLLVLWVYDRTKRDWLGIETIKSCKEYSGANRLVAFCSRLLLKSDLAAFIFLSLKEDSFVTMVYLRHGSHRYNGMSRRDWRIFLASHLFSNLYWAVLALGGISVFQWAWRLVGNA